MRYVALCAASAAVLVIGVYLFIQVHSSPARAEAPSHREVVAPVAAADTPAPAPSLPDEAPPDVTHGAAGQRTAAIVIKRPVTPRAPDDPPPPAGSDDSGAITAHVAVKANPKLDSVMAEASKAYDKGDLDEARDIAKKVLDDAPGNIRMLRIMVSAACLDNDQASATKYYAMLPKGDQVQMRTRCERYGITFPDSAAPTP